MYSSIPMNAGMPIPAVPHNFCSGPVYGNVPFHQPYPPAPFYPTVCNHFQPPAPSNNSLNAERNAQLPNFNQTEPSLFSQPPPGYSPTGQRIPSNSYHCNPMPYHPIHMTNVCSTPYTGFAVSNSTPVSNQFTRPPPPLPSGQIQNEKKKFSALQNNRRIKDAREFPYYCETCDRGFLSMEKFSEHKSQHITCGKQGCTFTGHPKIVEKHFMMQHRTGLFNRIVKGNSPEEIEKWINERKRHFPTKEKIEQKQAQRQEMEKRGERYAERKKSFNQRNPGSKGSHDRFNKNAGIRQTQFKANAFGRRGTFSKNQSTDGTETRPKRKDPVLNEDEDCVVRNLPPFKGTAYYLNLENCENDNGLDDDDISIISYDSDNCSTFTNDCADSTVSENFNSEMSNSNDFSTVIEAPCGISAEVRSVEHSAKKNDAVEHIIPPDTSNVNTEVDTSNNDHVAIPHSSVSLHQPCPVPESIPTLNNSLALIKCYDSDNCSDDDADIVDVKSTSCKTNTPPVLSMSQTISDDDSAPEEVSSKCVPNVEHEIRSNRNNDEDKKEDDKTCENKKRKRKRRKDGKTDDEDEASAEKQTPEERMPQIFQVRKRYRPPTLLEKLLSQEIKHERNVILQCVRYVVENNYFNIGQPK